MAGCEFKIFHSIVIFACVAEELAVFQSFIDFGESDSLAYCRKKVLYLCGNLIIAIFLGNFSSLYEFGLGI